MLRMDNFTPMKPSNEINYREKAASEAFAKYRRERNRKDFALFLFLSVVLLTVVYILAYTIAHAY